MTVRRRAGAIIAVVGLAGTGSVLLAAPAGAHGAPGNPASRAHLCGAHTDGARSAACRAAAKVSGRQALADWDNIRIADVAGRDRRVVPNGRLCSGGIDRFKGLDLARPDWPTTKLASGAGYKFKYRVTIPHRGSFRLYVTKDGYDPARPLRWSDLESRPFLTSVDPPQRNGSYVFAGRLPKAKAGRHLIYTIWQTSDTPDTYYSCSDVDFGQRDKGDDGAESGDLSAGTEGGGVATPGRPVSAAGDTDTGYLVPLVAGGIAALALVGGVVTVLVRRRSGGRHRV